MFYQIIKIFIMFAFTIAIMRLMGKSSIVQLTPYDLVAIIIVGTVVAEPLITADFIQAVILALIILLFYLIFARLTLNQTMNKFLLGEPSILIKHGKIIEDNMEKEHISLIQLLSILRTAGYSKLSEVNYAILEPTGSISVIPKPSARPVTLSDLDMEGQYEGLPIAVVIDGIVQKRNLKLINKDEKWLKERLAQKGIKELKDVIYAFIDDQSEELFLNLREPEKGEIKNFEAEESKNEKAVKEENELMKENKIFLVKDHKLQLEGLKEAGLSKSKLYKILNTSDLNEVKEVTLVQKLNVKRISDS